MVKTTYEPTQWTDHKVEKPRTYMPIHNEDGTLTLQPAMGNVLQQGTPINAERLNHMESGIKAALTAENVANNLTTTEPGYVLDARQGKALADLASGKASKTTATASLAVASWAGSGPYTQTVNVSGVTASNVVVVAPAPASFKVWGECGVYASAQAEGKLTFTAENKPDAALTVNVLCVN